MKRLNKKFKKELVEKYGYLKECGLSLKMIERYFKGKYGMKDISSIRKEYDSISRYDKLEVNIDDKSLQQISKAKSDLLVNRKINIQMNKDLHKIANDEARGQLIWDNFDKYVPDKDVSKCKPTNLLVERIINKPSDKDVIYVVGDVHYRGKIDDELVIKTFQQIKDDIEYHDYGSVSLVLTGDNIDGEIHNEQIRTNEPIMDQIQQILDLYIKCINDIPNIINVYMVYGNHEEIRLGGEKGTKNNAGQFIAWGLQKCLNASVSYGEELLIDYKGKNVLITHGHRAYCHSKTSIITHCAESYKKIPEYIILGHFHTSKANQFSKNQGLITAPALKNGSSRGDIDHGYCGLGQFLKIKLNMKSPQINTMDIE